ncbi:MAG TPA: GMP synthase, partial [archaeon]|nr:GMP synthase [archaeon]
GNEKESIVLRPINSTEAMTANFYEMKKEILNEMTEKLMQLNVSAVLFDLTDKPPGTIEWE